MASFTKRSQKVGVNEPDAQSEYINVLRNPRDCPLNGSLRSKSHMIGSNE